jgi:predicted phage terminase large subunit-like protein
VPSYAGARWPRFFRAGWPVLEASTPLMWGWHIEAICDHVQAVLEGWARRQSAPTYVQPIRDLLVSVGPGTLKSRIGVYATAWAWLRWPHLRVIAISCNPRVALRDSMLTRELIASRWYQDTFRPTWSIRSDEDSKGIFANTAGGFRSAHGLDARIVGTRADLLWVDDPHDPEEAESDAQRTAVLERWDMSIANRVNDLASSVRIGIAQRVHADDWSAARIAEGWTELRLPMEYEPETPCTTPIGFRDPRTVDGEVLQPTRFTPEVIAAEKLRCGSRRWAALYQQRPQAAGGNLIKIAWPRYWRRPGAPDAAGTRPRGAWSGPALELPKDFDAKIIVADLAFKKTETSDFNVIACFGKRDGRFWLLEQWRARADFPEVLRAYNAVVARHPTARRVVEAAANGHALVASLPGVVGIPAQGSKVQRLQAVLGLIEGGLVHVPEDWAGLDEWIAEITTVPSARHDDQADAMSLGLSQLALVEEDAGRDAYVRLLGYAPLQPGETRAELIERELRQRDRRRAGLPAEDVPASDDPDDTSAPPLPTTAEGWAAFAARLSSIRN